MHQQLSKVSDLVSSFTKLYFQSFSGSGLVILLNWVSVDTAQTEYSSNPNSYCDFNKERGKVSFNRIQSYQSSR